ncbi:DUF6097 family protein [Microbacterium halophytorum]|uniref:DUF6097 family protein n=1 Tax=Microbacterium halophytorum TaxID=2067568 RepID=UPI000CFD211B|nr:DUF6097 family protein [Microbacterium halophytorum]
MSSLSQAAGSVVASLQLSEELRRMHVAITERNLSVPLRDDFYEQCEALEQSVGGDEFRRAHRRVRLANALSGFLAVPVLIVVAVLVGMGYFVDGFDPIDWVVGNLWVVTLAAALIVAVLVLALVHSAARRRLLRVEYPALLARIGL